MKLEQKVVLSLGSNQGDRLENIENCIKLIHQKIGLVLSVSNLYETPSWGFESDAFYNCALLLHTHFSPEKILRKITSIEKQLGRIRKNTATYEARIIDIDIIAVDGQILDSETLKVPHPEMQNRLFVLLPMLDLKLEWQHPVTQKSIKELIENCEDKSDCVFVSDLKTPIIK
jgi:deoxyguanosine kinase